MLIEPKRGRGLEGWEKMEADPNGMGEAGGVAGAKSVAKRSSRTGLEGGVALPAGRGMSGETDSSGDGIFERGFEFGRGGEVKERALGGQCGH